MIVTVNLDGESVDTHEAAPDELLGRYSYGRYGLGVGTSRLIEILEKLTVKATWFIPSWDAERHPGVVQRIAEGGHEIAARGYRYEDHSQLGDCEREVLTHAHHVLQAITGCAPVGWRAPRGLLSSHTLELLAELGYVYDSSFQDDDLPYEVQLAGGRSIVELPQLSIFDDSVLYAAQLTSRQVTNLWLEEFDAVTAECNYVNITVNPRGDYGSGRPSRAAALHEFLGTIQNRSGIIFITCHDAAERWRTQLPDASPAFTDSNPAGREKVRPSQASGTSTSARE